MKHIDPSDLEFEQYLQQRLDKVQQQREQAQRRREQAAQYHRKLQTVIALLLAALAALYLIGALIA